MKATMIKISIKVNDCFHAQIYDKENKFLNDYEGYVPDFFPEKHYGDYVELTIDLEKGMVLNWPKDLNYQDFSCLITNDLRYNEDSEDDIISNAYIKDFCLNICSLKINIKVSDRFDCQVFDKENVFLGTYRGYVPNFFPNNNYGENLCLNIDIKTGKIINWKYPSGEIEEFEDMINQE